ncbi:EF-hand and coiled-coil domain-containing protein 1-like [Branchiostoma lanceolatum]|uniref:EF-hand and coiled-coil domain-containing protein 1-like n=1 Tax=Branchiostoma lanceolatum TaxID=7740 RepID=UPI003453BBB7
MDSCSDYCGLPARRTQWVVSALAHHYGFDRGVENEVVVLATGMDQYIQEIFHNLDEKATGTVEREDFEILCQILGLETRLSVFNGLPDLINFRVFHSKLCEYFCAKSGSQTDTCRPHVCKDSELIETEVHVRSPNRREVSLCPKCFCSKPTRERCLGRPVGQEREEEGDGSTEEHLEKAKKRVVQLEEEADYLREVVEDLRGALQTSDARSLALQVALRKAHRHHPECCLGKARVTATVGSRRAERRATGGRAARSRSADGRGYESWSLPRRGRTADRLRPRDDDAEWLAGEVSRLIETLPHSPREVGAMLRELKTIREARDSQVGEAMAWAENLQEDLDGSQSALRDIQVLNQSLVRQKQFIQGELEKARTALRFGLEKVRDLEAQATQVPLLQAKVMELQKQLDICRAGRGELAAMKEQLTLEVGYHSDQSERRSPAGHSDVSTPDQSVSSGCSEEQLFRAVEGRAASDDGNAWVEKRGMEGMEEEEEEDVEKMSMEKLAVCVEQLRYKLKDAEGEKITVEEQLNEFKSEVLMELHEKSTDIDKMQLELRCLETERVRLSIIEEKLIDILAVMRTLRLMQISRRSMGKLVLDSVTSSDKPQQDGEGVKDFLSGLYDNLKHCDLLLSGQDCQHNTSNNLLAVYG